MSWISAASNVCRGRPDHKKQSSIPLSLSKASTSAGNQTSCEDIPMKVYLEWNGDSSPASINLPTVWVSSGCYDKHSQTGGFFPVLKSEKSIIKVLETSISGQNFLPGPQMDDFMSSYNRRGEGAPTLMTWYLSKVIVWSICHHVVD